MTTHPYHEALKRAVEAAGGNQTIFANGIGTSQQMVSYWLKHGKPLPGEHVLPAERAGFGSRYELRPDLYPIEDSPPPFPTSTRGTAHRNPARAQA